MKKISLFLLLLSACNTFSFGKAVPVSIAKKVGYNYLHQKNASVNTADDLNLVYTSKGASDYFYVFSGANCFVIVSAEDGVIPVIGYGLDRPFHGDHVPNTVTDFFINYNKQIDYVIGNHISGSADIATQWDNLINNKSTPVVSSRPHLGSRTTGVFPSSTYYLLTTTWDQAPYYNANCPYDAGAGSNCVTGCVATATAQVMKYWNWPTTGAGINTYATSSYGTLSSDFGSHTYSWTSMPNSVTGPNAAVAQLMSDVGISVNMEYSPTESSAYVISSESPITNCAEYALKTYFGYASTLNGQARASYPDATWISMLEADIDLNRPVIYTGQGSSGGHCFVFDGYDAANNFHVNWGWSGSGPDGFYAIDALNPPVLGTGGAGGGFNSDQTAIFGVVPDTTTTTTPPASLQLYDFVNLTASTIGYGAPFTASTNIENTGTATFTGDFCAIAFDASSGSFITFVDSVMGTTLPPGDVFTSDLSFPTTSLLAMFPGNYTIGIFYRPTGGSWIAVANSSSGFYTNFAPITVVNSDPIELYAPMAPTPGTFVQGSPASVNLNLYNNGTYIFSGGTADFSGSFEVVLLNLDGSLNSSIQTMTGMSLPAGDDYTSPFLTFSTTSITAAPGTYLLTIGYNDGTGWYYAGADYYQNPVYINVVAPPPSPDRYEVNNTVAEAYDLTSTLSWVSNVAETGTPGSNFHIVTDQDYYKFELAAGYNYTIHARVNDILNSDDGSTYTVDCAWSYSTDGGTTWSAVYQNTIPGGGTIDLGGGTGGTVIFHCSPRYPGDIGTYVLKVENITRVSTSSVPLVSLQSARIFPNPASDQITIDLSGTGTKGIEATLFDMQGKKVYSADVSNQAVFTIPVNSLAAAMYFVQVSTDAGMINKKITVSGK